MAYLPELSSLDEYEDLRVELRREDGILVSRTNHRGEWATDRHDLPADPYVAEKSIAWATGSNKWLKRSGVLSGSATSAPDPIRDLGSRLYAGLFSGRLGRLYATLLDRAESKGYGVRLWLALGDDELAALPWEFLYDPRRQDFLALSLRSPVVRTRAFPSMPGRPVRRDLPLRLLAVTAPVVSGTGNLGEQQELLVLKDLESRYGGLLDVEVLERANRTEFLRRLRDRPYDVLHFIGTGLPPQRRLGREKQALLVSSDPSRPIDVEVPRPEDLVDADMLRDALQRHSPQLVYLNACHTDGIAGELLEVAQATIGLRSELAVETCIMFARAFLSAVLEGQSLDRAMTIGRRDVDERMPGTHDWGFVQIHQRGDSFALLAPQPPPHEGADHLDPPRARGRQYQILASKLGIQKRNLEALKARLDRFAGVTAPKFLLDEISDTEASVARIERELADLDTRS